MIRPGTVPVLVLLCAAVAGCEEGASTANLDELVSGGETLTAPAKGSNWVLNLNGQPVFPVCLALPPDPDSLAPNGLNAFDEIASAGVNFVRTGASSTGWTEDVFGHEQHMLDAAAAHGMYAWMYLNSASSVAVAGDANDLLLQRIVTTFKDHPGLGAYKGYDEPAWGGAPLLPIANAYRTIKALDPVHPVVIIEAPRLELSKIRPYNAVADVHGVDIYPVSYPAGIHSDRDNTAISLVGEWTRDMAYVAGRYRGVWTTVQIAWSGTIVPGRTLRMANFSQERFMVYEAIIEGARGITFFGGHLPQAFSRQDVPFNWNWSYWTRVVRPLIEEIGTHSELYPALVAPNSTLPVKANKSGIEFTVREVGNQVWVIASKRTMGIEQVKFTGLPLNLSYGSVLYEGQRYVAPDNGTFTDWFAPWDVHVYRFIRM